MSPSKRSSSRAGVRVDALSMLKEDHAVVRKLLRSLERTETNEGTRRSTLLEQVAREIEIHAAIEEDIFYPAFKERAREEHDQELFFEAAEEHGLVHHVLPTLRETDVESPLFSARAKVLKDLVEHHAEEEETEMFPRARKLMDREALVELGRRLEQAKAKLKESLSTERSDASPGGR